MWRGFSVFSAIVLVSANVAFATGGLDHPDGTSLVRVYEVTPGKVYRGSMAEWSADLGYLKDKLHIKTILNLETPFFPTVWEEAFILNEEVRAKSFGIDTVRIGIPASVAQPSEDAVRRAVKALENPDLWPIYVHCTIGRDRTGLVVALYRVDHDHWTKKQARAFDMDGFGFDDIPVLRGLTAFWNQHVPDDINQPGGPTQIPFLQETN